MNRILYQRRCQCKENVPIIKKQNSITRKKERAIQYPKLKQKNFKDQFEFEKEFQYEINYLPQYGIELEDKIEFEDEIKFKTFHIRYPQKLSLTAKFILNSFQNKYLYYAIDDILDTFKASPMEQDNLLEILYSPVLSLHNNSSVNFFDIWINQLDIEEIPKTNKFLTHHSESLIHFTSITIQFYYKINMPPKKQESLW